MAKQYPRLEISLLCKNAPSLAQCCIMMRRPELEVRFQDDSVGFQDDRIYLAYHLRKFLLLKTQTQLD